MQPNTILNHPNPIPAIDLVPKFYKDIRGWTIGTLLLGVLSLFANIVFAPIWGIILIIVAILSWKNKIPGMYGIYAVILGWLRSTILWASCQGVLLAEQFWPPSKYFGFFQ